MKQDPIIIETTVAARPEKAWELYTGADHLVNWNHASDDWYCPSASNDLRPGGELKATMAARDGSVSFEFVGIYDQVTPPKSMSYTMGDGRHVSVQFEPVNESTRVTTTFEPETQHSLEMQREGWQAILDNYAKYVAKSEGNA